MAKCVELQQIFFKTVTFAVQPIATFVELQEICLNFFYKLLIFNIYFKFIVQSIIGATEIRGFNDSSGCIKYSRMWTRKERAALYEFYEKFTNHPHP